MSVTRDKIANKISAMRQFNGSVIGVANVDFKCAPWRCRRLTVKPKMAEQVRRISVKKPVGRIMRMKRIKLRGRPIIAEYSRKSLVEWLTAAELIANMLDRMLID
jgi:hypothetical protein